MTGHLRIFTLGFALALAALVGSLAPEAWARGRGRARPAIQRSGPASHGSFGREPETYRQIPRARDPDPDRLRAPAIDPRPDLRPDARPDPAPDPLAPQRDDEAPIPDPADRIVDRDELRDRARRRHRAWRRGDQITYVEWEDYACGETVVRDGRDELYECEGVWFIRTYYGGEVVYTATDPPRGY